MGSSSSSLRVNFSPTMASRTSQRPAKGASWSASNPYPQVTQVHHPHIAELHGVHGIAFGTFRVLRRLSSRRRNQGLPVDLRLAPTLGHVQGVDHPRFALNKPEVGVRPRPSAS